MPGVGTTHHVKIGDDYHLVRPHSYRRMGAPVFGARFTTGDPDYSRLNLWQYWVQSCWVGGIGAEEWIDDSMYDEAVGVDTTQHEVMMLTRDMGVRTNSDLDGESSARRFIVYSNRLYCLSYGTLGSVPSKLWKWTMAGDPNPYEWELVHTFNDACRSIEVFAGKLWIGDYGSTLIYYNGSTFTHINKPSGTNNVTPYAMKVYRDHMYVAFHNDVWRLKKDLTWDGSTVFYEANCNYITQMEVHLGFLYMASQDGKIFRTDGNNTFDMWTFEPGNVITSIRSFDGRLFLAVNEPLDGTTAQQAVLYQFSGAAVTELKRWGKEGEDISMGQLRTIGHRMYFGAGGLLGMGDGFGIGVYDPREDSYHIWSSNRDTATYAGGTEGVGWTVDDVFYFAGYVFASVRSHGIFVTKWSYKDASRALATYDTTAAGVAASAGNGGWLTSSDFDAGTPGLKKLWDAIIIEADIPHTSCSIHVEISTDGGQTWDTMDSITKPTGATRISKNIPLTVSSVRLVSSRIKWRLTLRTDNTNYSPFVRGVVVRYLPIPEPNWKWDMVLVLSDKQQLLDGTIETVDVESKLSALETAFRSGMPVAFTDIDGTAWSGGALITDYRADIRYIGPTSDGDLEAEVTIALVEVKDSYEVLG